ncbi:MAG: hypothetical protein P8Y60_09885, partial [Calditrichota bacterium]
GYLRGSGVPFFQARFTNRRDEPGTELPEKSAHQGESSCKAIKFGNRVTVLWMERKNIFLLLR